MWNARLVEAQAGIKIAKRNINKLRYANNTTLTAESEDELKSFLMRVREESEKAGLKFNIQKTKIMASGPITSWQIEGEELEAVTDLILLGSQITVDSECSHEIKQHLLFGRKAMANVIVVQSHNHVQLFATPWTAALQASLSFTISQSLLKLMLIESVMHTTISSSVVPFSSCPQSFPAPGSLLMSQFFTSGGQSIGVSASASVLPMNI